MNNTTICHAFGIDAFLENDANGRAGCLIQIYPADGTIGIWELAKEEVFLGRDLDCEICLAHESVSRCHAVLQPHADGFQLVDLGSTNGTYVNDEKIDDRWLSAGDRIRLGTHILKYLSTDYIEAQYHETMFKLITMDGLTDAYNRRYLQDWLMRELDHGKRRSRPLSVALIDVDYFKNVNDTYGHLAGDEVLQELSHRAQRIFRENDLFARYGGEEFCAVFLDTNYDKAMAAVERARREIASRPFHTHCAEIGITVSIGFVSTSGTGKVSVDELLGLADAQLFRAKHAGRNCTRGVNHCTF